MNYSKFFSDLMKDEYKRKKPIIWEEDVLKEFTYVSDYNGCCLVKVPSKYVYVDLNKICEPSHQAIKIFNVDQENVFKMSSYIVKVKGGNLSKFTSEDGSKNIYVNEKYIKYFDEAVGFKGIEPIKPLDVYESFGKVAIILPVRRSETDV